MLLKYMVEVVKADPKVNRVCDEEFMNVISSKVIFEYDVISKNSPSNSDSYTCYRSIETFFTSTTDPLN